MVYYKKILIAFVYKRSARTTTKSFVIVRTLRGKAYVTPHENYRNDYTKSPRYTISKQFCYKESRAE